jgi:Fibronectin type III domain
MGLSVPGPRLIPMRQRRSGAAGAALTLLAVGLMVGAPAGAVLPGDRPVAPVPGGTPAAAATGGPGASAAAAPARPANGSGPVANALVDAPCNATGSNAEVLEAYDPVATVLYETWIGCGGIGFSRSTDSGATFGSAVAVDGSLTGSSWDPAIAVAPNGTVYVAYMLNNGSGDTPAVAWSFDHGVSFSGFAPVFAANTSEFSDRDYLAVAPNGTIYVSWDLSPDVSVDQIGCAYGGSCYFTAGDYNIVVAWSADGGSTWGRPVPVEPEYPWAAAPAGPLLVEPNGTIDLLYEDYATFGAAHSLGVGRNYFVQSSDGGPTWSTPVAVENGTFPNDTWWIDGDLARDSSGTLYASFDSRNATVDTAYVAVSRDDGASWSAPIRLNPDEDGAHHVLAAVAGGENGTAYLAWMSDNATGGWSTYAATLYGNGSTLSEPTLASDRYGLVGQWIGDTLGLAVLASGQIAVSWSYGVVLDNRTGSQVFAAVLSDAPPVDAPVLTSVVPGVGSVTLTWRPPTGAGNWVGGYRLVWGLDNQITFYNRSLGPSETTSVVRGLPAFVPWYFEVAAVNGAGVGPYTPPVEVDLLAWGVVRGTVAPVNASVVLDGVPVAVNGGSFLANSTNGPHVLVVSAHDYSSAYFSLDLPWNGTLWRNATLELAPSTVEGRIVPADANATFDGSNLTISAQGDFEVSGVASGTHRLSVSRRGFVPQDLQLAVGPNATVWYNVTLSPANGTLSLTVDPAAAHVVVGGAAVALSADGSATVSLLPGRYPVEVTLAGFVPYFTNATVASLAVVPLTITLEAVPPPENATGSGGSGFPVAEVVLIASAVGIVAGVLAAALFLRRGRGRGDEGAAPEPAGPIWEADDGPEPEPEPAPPDEPA